MLSPLPFTLLLLATAFMGLATAAPSCEPMCVDTDLADNSCEASFAVCTQSAKSDCLAVSLFGNSESTDVGSASATGGNARGGAVAVAGEGNAAGSLTSISIDGGSNTRSDGGVAVAGEGNSYGGLVGIAPRGNAEGGLVAISGEGNAQSGLLAVSLLGHANGPVPVGPLLP